MKTNIKIVDTNNNPINPTDKHTLRWYKWEEYCDDCGKSTSNSELFHSNVPDLNEADYCYECLKKRFSKQQVIPDKV